MTTLHIAAGLSIILGFMQCFSGYRLFKVVLRLTGFMLGAALTGTIVFNISQSEIAAFIAALIGGLAGAALMGMIYFVGVFIIGAFLGGIVGYVIFALLEQEPMMAIVALLAIIFGAASLVYQKIMIITATGFGGAWNITAGITFLINYSIRENIYLVVLCWLIFGVTGSMTQFKANRKTL